MTAKDLAKSLVGTTASTNDHADRIVKAVFGTIEEKLKAGEEVEIYGFGKFVTIDCAARNARNPKTGECVCVPAKKAIRFKVSSKLKKAVTA